MTLVICDFANAIYFICSFFYAIRMMIAIVWIGKIQLIPWNTNENVFMLSFSLIYLMLHKQEIACEMNKMKKSSETIKT